MMKIFKLSLVALLILGPIYFFLDQKLFYYGKNDLPIHNSLPLGITPEFDILFDGFVLWDKHGFAHIGKGVRYWGSDIIIDEIIKYGFNNQKIVSKVNDKDGKVYYIETKRNENPQSKQEFEKTFWSESEKPIFNDYEWIELKGNEEHIRKLVLCRNYIFLTFVFLMLFGIFKIVKTVSKLIS